MTDEDMASEAPSDIRIVGLAPTFQAFGAVLDFLAEADPFRLFELASIAPVIRTQLQAGHNLAAMQGDRLVGYVGWLLTTEVVGSEWMENRAILRPLTPEESDAAALTIVASEDKSATMRMIRGARELNKGRRVFFKRGYDAQVKAGRKSTVLNSTRAE